MKNFRKIEITQVLKAGLLGCFLGGLVFAFCLGVQGASGGLSSYRENLRTWRELRENYEIARERHLKLGTLSSRDDLVDATWEFLQQGCVTVRSYFSYLLWEVEDRKGVPESFQEDADEMVAQRSLAFSRLERQAGSTDSLAELESVAEELEAVYKANESHASYLQTIIMLGNLNNLREDVQEIAAEVRSRVEDDEDYPGHDKILGEWYEKITTKLEDAELYQEELWQGLETFGDVEKQNERLRLLESLGEDAELPQGLISEVINHLLEIVRARKY